MFLTCCNITKLPQHVYNCSSNRLYKCSAFARCQRTFPFPLYLTFFWSWKFLSKCKDTTLRYLLVGTKHIIRFYITRLHGCLAHNNHSRINYALTYYHIARWRRIFCVTTWRVQSRWEHYHSLYRLFITFYQFIPIHMTEICSLRRPCSLIDTTATICAVVIFFVNTLGSRHGLLHRSGHS